MHCTIAYTSLLAWMLDHDTCTVDDIRRIGLVVPAPFVRKLHVLKAVIEAGVFDRFYGTLMIHQFYDHTPELVDFARDGGFYVTETKGRFDNLVVFVEDVLMPELRTFVESLPANDPMRHTLYDYCSGERFEGQSLDDVVPDLFPT